MDSNFDDKLTLIDRLAEHAVLSPTKASYVFLTDNAAAEEIGFRDLRARVAVIAAALADRFAPGERVLLLLPTGLEFIVAFLASLEAGLIAVPGYPPRQRRSSERLRAMLSDAAPAVALVSDKDNAAVAELVRDREPGLAVLSLDDLKAVGSTVSRVSPTRRNRIAFLQYTSGSTGRPRGVVVTQTNLMRNSRQMQRQFDHTPQSLVVSWLPIFHDMGLVGCVLQSLSIGFTSVLLSPVSFVLEPARWLRAATDFRATIIGGPNFAYDLCTKNITAEQKRDLELSSLQVAFNGSEPVRLRTMEGFTAAFSGCGFNRKAFFPCYGLAESTLFVSGGPVGSGVRTLPTCSRELERHRIVHVSDSAPSVRSLVSSGRIADGTDVVIVDPRRKRMCKRDTVGEIWIASESVADGYWNNCDATEKSFGGVLADDLTARRYLRTGDTGIIDDGELFIIGRIKDVIILRGRKIYPQDVEAVVEGVLGRVQANYVAAFSADSSAGETLSVVIEADRKVTQMLRFEHPGRPNVPENDSPDISRHQSVGVLIGTIREAVSRALDVAVQSVYFMRIGTFPRTSSGKVRRRACKAAVTNEVPDVIFEWHFAAGGVSQPHKMLPKQAISQET